MRKGNWSNVLRLLLFLGISVFFIYWFLIKLEPEQKSAIWQSFIQADYFWVLIVMACCMLSHLVRALRWRLLLKPLGYSPSINNTFGAVVLAYMANLAFPRLGEFLRCAVLKPSDDIPVQKSVGTVVTERLVDVVLFAIVVLLGLLLMFDDIKDWLYDGLVMKFESVPSMGILLIVLVAIVLVFFLVYRVFRKSLYRLHFVKKTFEFIKGCIDGLMSIFHLGCRNTVLFISYSLLIYLLYMLGGLIIFQAFPETTGLGLKAAFALYLFGSIGMTFSQGGLGVYPKLVQMALALYAVSLEVGTAVGWLLWGSQQVIVIVVGLVYAVYFSLLNKKNKLK